MKIQLANLTTALLVNSLIAISVLAIQPQQHATRSFDDSGHVRQIFALHATGEEQIATIEEKIGRKIIAKAMKKQKTPFLKELAKNDMLQRYDNWTPDRSGSF